MAQIQKVIEQLGYSPNEAKVYLCALAFGECRVSNIAAKLKLPLSSTQAIVDKLHKNGLINFYVKNRYKYWVAESPEKLLQQLRLREESVLAALPALTALRKKNSTLAKPAVKVFTGREDIRSVLDDIIHTKHLILAVIPEDSFLDLLEGTSMFEDFTSARVRGNLRMRVLAPDTPRGRKLADAGSKELREMRFLPSQVGVETAHFIYANKVAHMLFNQHQPTAVLIEDAGLSATEAARFEDMWEHSGPDGGDDSPFAKRGLFKTLADNSPQPLLITDSNIEIVYVNAAWEKQFGYLFSEVKGQNPHVFQSGKTPRGVYKEMWSALEAGKSFQSDEIIDKKKNGELFTLMTTIFPITSGNRTWYVQALDDLTEGKRVKELLKNLQQSAE